GVNVDTNSWLASAEIYDPTSESWSTVGSLATARDGHTATLLGNGEVLAAGGQVGYTSTQRTLTATAEIYNPATSGWSAAGSLPSARFVATASLLSTGNLLVAGGEDNSGALASAALYEPAPWRDTGSMANARENATATLLTNGTVLVAGGSNGSPLTSAELYDPANGASPAAGSMATPRQPHTARRLQHGTHALPRPPHGAGVRPCTA